jgi:predicted PurR-regulated permease PerM
MSEIEKKLLNPKNITLLLFILVTLLSIFFIFDILYPFIIAFTIAYLLSPLTLKLNQYFSRVFSSFISIFIFILLISFVFSLIIPILVVQFEKLVQMAPMFADKIRKILSYILDKHKSISLNIFEKKFKFEDFVIFVKKFLISSNSNNI